MTNEDMVLKDLQDIDNETIQVVCNLISQYNNKTQDYLVNFVASICDVTPQDLLVDTKKLYNAHARWLYWYAYRYMTNESYEAIAKRTQSHRKFTESCVGICVSKMSTMIEQEAIWKKRWVLVKRIVKAMLGAQNEKQDTITLKVTQPKGIDIKLQIINEK